jgi:hypothetical protein
MAPQRPPLLRELAGELLGSSLLVAVAFASGVVRVQMGGGSMSAAVLGSVALGLGYGLVVWSFGGISGAQTNPLVSVVASLLGGQALTRSYEDGRTTHRDVTEDVIGHRRRYSNVICFFAGHIDRIAAAREELTKGRIPPGYEDLQPPTAINRTTASTPPGRMSPSPFQDLAHDVQVKPRRPFRDLDECRGAALSVTYLCHELWTLDSTRRGAATFGAGPPPGPIRAAVGGSDRLSAWKERNGLLRRRRSRAG